MPYKFLVVGDLNKKILLRLRFTRLALPVAGLHGVRACLAQSGPRLALPGDMDTIRERDPSCMCQREKKINITDTNIRGMCARPALLDSRLALPGQLDSCLSGSVTLRACAI